ncbi:hypothetical protein AAFF_G00180720 [Aldrovandia affinis]|uniref:Uncharacterized protein n=1 Tax=Aldrovandia affinis TaxID=143900 RepID=A0AAD7SZL4_9TELE|nr:hypothetical protein AAFF_G00180720 [Aldrovandia affinis]
MASLPPKASSFVSQSRPNPSFLRSRSGGVDPLLRTDPLTCHSQRVCQAAGGRRHRMTRMSPASRPINFRARPPSDGRQEPPAFILLLPTLVSLS